jgi:anti-sigma-K factor RskA
MTSEHEDRDELAAEYALGTLDADERAQAEARMLVDPAFAEQVQQWERRLGELNALVVPIEPPETVWDRIKAGLPNVGQAELRLPEAPAPAAREADTSAEIVALARRVKRWRGASIIAAALAACLIGFIIMLEVRPDLLPGDVRLKQVVEKPVEVVKEVVREVPSAQAAQYVAVFQKDEQSPAFLLTVDTERRIVTVRHVAAERLPDKTYELWIATQPGAAPRSLGLIANDDFTVRATLAAYDPAVINNATFGISLEPLGGSPTGTPTGPVIHARLLQVTPPQNP